MLKHIFLILIICGLTKTFSQNKTLDSILITHTASERATHYLESNKIIENSETVIFTLLEYESNNYYNYLYKFDKLTKQIKRIKIGKSVLDNHCGSAIIADTKGYIYLVVGSHNNSVDTYKSDRPWSISKLKPLNKLKGEYTYPNLVLNPLTNTPYLLLRETNYSSAWNLSLFKLKDDKYWNHISNPAIGNYVFWKSKYGVYLMDHTKGYQNFSATLEVDKLNNLHLLYRIYEYLPKKNSASTDVLNPYQKLGASYLIGYSLSHDGGSTWMSSNGQFLEELSPLETNIIRGSKEPNENSKFLDISNLAIDDRNTCYFLFTERNNDSFNLFVCRIDNFNKRTIEQVVLPEGITVFSKPRLQIDNGKLKFLIQAMETNEFSVKDTWGSKKSFNLFGIINSKTLDLEKTIYLKNKPSWPATLSYHKTKNEDSWTPILINKGSKSIRQSEVYLYFFKIKND